MKNELDISPEELADMQRLGGFEVCLKISDQILREHGLNRSLFSEKEARLISQSQAKLIPKKAVRFHFDPGKSLRANIEDLFLQAQAARPNSGGANYVGAMLQHLVGAKLDLVLGSGKVSHHGSSVADKSGKRRGDFEIDTVVLHVTTHPTEALACKCADNLRAGLRPVIVTIDDGVSAAAFLLRNVNLEERVDILDAKQFLTANVYERSLFQAAGYRMTFTKLLRRYNEIVSTCETDPALYIDLGETSAH